MFVMIKYIFITLIFVGCSVDSINNEFRIFERYKGKSNYQSAITSLNKIISTSKNKDIIKKAYLEKADLNLTYLNQPESAIQVYSKLSQLSEGLVEKNNYKYLIAKIYYENLNDYDAVIREVKNINLNDSKIDIVIKVKHILIESYKNKKEYYQALIELKQLFKNNKIKQNESYFELKNSLSKITYI